MLGPFDRMMAGESGLLSVIVTRGLKGLKGEHGNLEFDGNGDKGISMIGLGVFRGGTEYSEVPVDLKTPFRTFHGL